MTPRDGHIRILPLQVANKIAAGEVVERPASVVKELVENALDAGAKTVKIAIAQGGRKLISVQDDGCGMTRDDAVLSLERQATSKILDVGDIEEIDTLGFRGEAIPSIASVSRFTLTTRRHDADEGTTIQVDAGVLAEVRAAGCPPGTRVEVRDLFCNVPARRKFLRAYATEEGHVRQTFTVHALAHPAIGFSLSVDGREIYRLAPSATLKDRVLELFGRDFAAEMVPVCPDEQNGSVRVSGFVERPNLNQPTRREQFVFVNGRPATSPSIAYALREAYPRRPGDVRPAVILFIDLPPKEVDVNVHPAKREVRFRDNQAVKAAVMAAVGAALRAPGTAADQPNETAPTTAAASVDPNPPQCPPTAPTETRVSPLETPVNPPETPFKTRETPALNRESPNPQETPIQVEFAVSPDSTASRPWKWFHYLAQTGQGFILIETDAGLVTVNPRAARERLAYERLMADSEREAPSSQTLLIPEIVHLPPADAARLKSALPAIREMGFSVEEFGRDTFKVDAVPQLIGSMSPGPILETVSHDLAESGSRRGGERWREERIAKSVAKSFAGASRALTDEGAVRIVEDLSRARMPYVCPRGKPTLFFISNQELNRKFALD